MLLDSLATAEENAAIKAEEFSAEKRKLLDLDDEERTGEGKVLSLKRKRLDHQVERRRLEGDLRDVEREIEEDAGKEGTLREEIELCESKSGAESEVSAFRNVLI